MPLLFAVALFVSAFLLFLVQPMVGKMLLPLMGGTPAVWNTCMVFFQAALLIGYAYTHTVSNWRDRRKQLITQIVLLALPLLVLPFTLGAWNGLQFPKGTPEPIVRKVNEALSKVLDMPETRQRLDALGIEVAPPDRRAPSWFGPFIKSEIARWKPLLEAELANQKK